MTEAQLMLALEKALNDAIRETSNKIANSLEKKLGSRVHHPYYDRTGQIIDAFRNPPYVKFGPTGKVDFVTYDSKRIRSFKGNRGRLHHHMSVDGSSVYKGVPISELVPIWINYDNTAPNGRPIKGLHYLESALGGQTVESYLTKKFLKKADKAIKQAILSFARR